MNPTSPRDAMTLVGAVAQPGTSGSTTTHPWAPIALGVVWFDV
jgi:hypothetical protein